MRETRIEILSLNQLSRMMCVVMNFLRITMTSVYGLIGLCDRAIGINTSPVKVRISSSVIWRFFINSSNYWCVIVKETISLLPRDPKVLIT
jgi:hypothetical protein